MKIMRTNYENGQIESELWVNEAGYYHRLDGPAIQWWFEDGQLEVESWIVNGVSHRLDGPAYRLWRRNGRLVEVQWWISGVEYKTEAEFQVAIDLCKANEIAELF